MHITSMHVRNKVPCNMISVKVQESEWKTVQPLDNIETTKEGIFARKRINLLQVFAIELITFAVDFVLLAVECGAFAVEFVGFVPEFVALALQFVTLAIELDTFAMELGTFALELVTFH